MTENRISRIVRHGLAALALSLFPAALALAQGHAHTDSGMLAFPGAQGWARFTPGGRGGAIIRVTTLAESGPGSLRAAVETPGPRIIVFEVGGVIDLGMRTLQINEPFVTIAGQTAPSPGITLVRGGIDVRGHDVIIQHLRIRPGSAGGARASGWGEDGISTVAAWQVIVDHCSLTWATDENLSASGPRFTGSTPDEWGEGTSHRITFSHNIIAEGLADSTHPKFEHSKGSLIHDNAKDLLIYGNLYAHNWERSPLFKGGVRGTVVNNFIYDPGPRAIHYNLMALEWGEVAPANGRLTAVGNVLRMGPSSPADLAFLMIGGEGDLDYHGRDNIAVDRLGEPLAMFGRYTTSTARIIESTQPLDWPQGLEAKPANQVELWVLGNAGARPWDRDAHDVRVLANAAEGRGWIIDSEDEVGGYPVQQESRRPFDPNLWNLDDMNPRSADVLDGSRRSGGT